MNKVCGIYKITNLINGKIYIGQSTDIYARWKGEKRGNINNHLKSSFKKYGLKNFKFSIIEQCDITYLDNREKYYIDKFMSYDPKKGYNKKFGGGGGIPTQETKDKMKKSHKSRQENFQYKHSQETKEKISQAMKGKTKTKECKTKLSESLKKRVISEETKEKIRTTINLKKTLPEYQEYREKMRKKSQGRIHNEEIRQKISEGKRRSDQIKKETKNLI